MQPKTFCRIFWIIFLSNKATNLLQRNLKTTTTFAVSSGFLSGLGLSRPHLDRRLAPDMSPHDVGQPRRGLGPLLDLDLGLRRSFRLFLLYQSSECFCSCGDLFWWQMLLLLLLDVLDLISLNLFMESCDLLWLHVSWLSVPIVT